MFNLLVLFQPDNRAINRTSRLFLRYLAVAARAAASSELAPMCYSSCFVAHATPTHNSKGRRLLPTSQILDCLCRISACKFRAVRNLHSMPISAFRLAGLSQLFARPSFLSFICTRQITIRPIRTLRADQRRVMQHKQPCLWTAIAQPGVASCCGSVQKYRPALEQRAARNGMRLREFPLQLLMVFAVHTRLHTEISISARFAFSIHHSASPPSDFDEAKYSLPSASSPITST